MHRWAVLLVVLGVAAGVMVGIERHHLEQGFDRVELALDWGDLALALDYRDDQLPPVDVLAELYRSGVDSLVLTAPLNLPRRPPALAAQAQAIRDAGLRVILKVGEDGDYALVPGAAQDGGSIAPLPSYPLTMAELAQLVDVLEPHVLLSGTGQVPGFPDQLQRVTTLLGTRGIRFGIQEFARQQGENQLARTAPWNLVRVHTIYPKELPRYGVNSAQLRFLRAVAERSYRLLYVRALPAKAGGADLTATVALVANLRAALQGRGYTRGEASRLPPWRTGWSLFGLAVAGWLGASLILWEIGAQKLYLGQAPGLLRGGIRSVKRFLPWLLGIVASGIIVVFLRGQETLARQLAALLSAVTFPVLAALPQRWLPPDPARPASKSMALTFGLRQFAATTAIAAVGGLVVVAVLGEYRFMLKIAEFRGVKVMSLLPLACTAWGAVSWTWAVGLPDNWRGGRRRVSPWLQGGIALAVVGAVIIYVGRTGNFIIPVAPWEIRFREFLETAFAFRPRTKEAFIGHPLMVLGLGLYRWGWQRLGVWLTVVGSVGQISVVNTFTHVHASLYSAVYRTIGGCLVGGSLGCLLLMVAMHLIDHGTYRRDGDKGLPR